jgi:tetratricopeptide (TPR) repeat protein
MGFEAGERRNVLALLGGRRYALGAVVLLATAAVLTTVGIASGGSTPTKSTASNSSTPYVSSAQAPFGTTGADPVARDILRQQKRLKTVPGDWTAWAGLAADYVQEGRITADPTYYAKADGALAQSFKIEPQQNFLALTVKATVSAARHDFAGALVLTDQSLKIDAYDSTTYGVRGDALDELGRYSEALTSFEKQDSLSPNVSSFSRLSYAYELRGDLTKAKGDLLLALNNADSPSDKGFAAYYLGELAWNRGDFTEAERYYRQGVSLDPDYVPPLEGVAKVEAALGQKSNAIRDYEQVVNRLPQPSYVIEFGDYLASIGESKKAQEQYSLVLAEEKIFQAQGVNVDLELSLFQADHGKAAEALKTAAAEYGRRHSTLVEDAYGWALHMNGQDAAALPHAVAALRLGSKSALFYFHKGVIEQSLGQSAATIADLRQALAINPHFSALQAPEATKLLKQLGAS